jgi:hypothetical protein
MGIYRSEPPNTDHVVSQGTGEMATGTSKTADVEWPPGVFEVLVAIWTEILVDDYEARHGSAFHTKAGTPGSRSSYDVPAVPATESCRS